MTSTAAIRRAQRAGPAAIAGSLVALVAVACGADPTLPDSDEVSTPPSGGEAPATVPAAGTVLLYVADRYDGVFELDPDTLEVIDRIETGPRAHGLVASPDGRTLYITVETSNELLAVDVVDNRIIGRTVVGPVPNEPTISRDGRFVYVPQRGGDQTDVVDTETMAVIKTIPAGSAQHNAYTSADGRHIYVTSMGDDLVSVIDAASQEIIRQVPMGGVPRPVALTDDESLAYVALSGLLGFVVWDLESDEIVERVEIPVPDGTAPPPLDTYTHGLLLTPNQRELWVAGYAVEKVFAFTVPELQQIAEIDVDGGPHWFTLHPSGEPLYVTLETGGTVSQIHRGLRQVLRTAPVGEAPTRILAFASPVQRRGATPRP